MSEIQPPRREDIVDVLHGQQVHDPYRWLEDGSDPQVIAWQDAERARFRAFTQALPQRKTLSAHLERLWRVDDERPPHPVIEGERLFVRTRRADQDKWVIQVQDGPDAPRRVALDPNGWDKTQTLAGFWPSPDGRRAVVGRARAGNEDPELLLLDVDTGVLRDEPTIGWRRSGVCWHPEGTGFWFSGRPAAGTVEPGEENYWHRVWFHRLGAPPESDQVAISDEQTRERFHGVQISEDGRWLVLGRYRFSSAAIWVEERSTGTRRLATEDVDAHHDVVIVDDILFVRTDWGAPRFRLMRADPADPHRDGWVEVVPEGRGTLTDVRAIGGRLYLTWQEDVSDRTAVYDLDGNHLHDVPWPGQGSVSVWGRWERPEVWATFESYATPRTTYTYDPELNALDLYQRHPMPLDTSGLRQRQIWFESRDGTRVPMHVLDRADAPEHTPRPFLLTGYGGFNVSRPPAFSSIHALWALLGGGVAVANLRGGGEFGRAWHEAGKGTVKQNVFDDFIAAAETLIEQGMTSPEHLAISGGSNGGLLVAAAITQRPELFAAARCAVPLTDMIRFPRFGIAAIWTEEYGDPEADADAFAAIHAYSPYHRTRPGQRYPATLVTGSLNDARTDPVHARKMYAALQHADPDGGQGERPILLHVQEESGHHGAVTIEDLADQLGRDHGFLMSRTGLEVPEVLPSS